MKKLLLFTLFVSTAAIAQVGINTAAPLSLLDIRSSNQATPANTDGIMIPKINAFPTPSPGSTRVGMMVYLTTTLGSNRPGFYYWSGSGWRGVGTATSWSLGGNTTSAGDYIGTNTLMPLTFRVGGTNAGRLEIGSGNTSLGYYSVSYSLTGQQNTSFGTYSQPLLTTGFANTSMGYQAMNSTTTGNRNVAVGQNSLSLNVAGSENISVGWSAMNANTVGWYNVGVGSLALRYNTSGNYNVATGYRSMMGVTTGTLNSTYGTDAGYWIGGAVNNVTCLGYGAGFSTTVSNHVNIGNGSSTWIGGQTNWGTFSDARTKDNVQENVKGLDFIKKLRPVTYNFNYHKEYELLNEGRKDTSANWQGKYDIEKIRFSGFIAQEAEAAAQQSGYDFSGIVPPPNGKGAYTVRYAEFVVPLVKAVQEQQAHIERLEQTMQAMERRLTELEIQNER